MHHRNRKARQIQIRKKEKKTIKSPVPKETGRAEIRRNQTRVIRSKITRKAGKRKGKLLSGLEGLIIK